MQKTAVVFFVSRRVSAEWQLKPFTLETPAGLSRAVNQVVSYHRQHPLLGLAADVDYRRSVTEPQREPRSVSAAATRRLFLKQLARPIGDAGMSGSHQPNSPGSELAGGLPRGVFSESAVSLKCLFYPLSEGNA